MARALSKCCTLPDKKNSSLALHPQGHQFEFPSPACKFFKCSFANRCLFDFVYLWVFICCVLHLRLFYALIDLLTYLLTYLLAADEEHCHWLSCRHRQNQGLKIIHKYTMTDVGEFRGGEDLCKLGKDSDSATGWHCALWIFLYLLTYRIFKHTAMQVAHFF